MPLTGSKYLPLSWDYSRLFCCLKTVLADLRSLRSSFYLVGSDITNPPEMSQDFLKRFSTAPSDLETI